MKFDIKHSLILFFIINASCVDGQKFNFTQYTVEDGLPTNYVYGVVEDKAGYIWAYTENGISKFDGYTFQNYSTLDGLPSNDIFHMIRDTFGTLWLNHSNLGPCYIANDSISKYENKTQKYRGFFQKRKNEVIYKSGRESFSFSKKEDSKEPIITSIGVETGLGINRIHSIKDDLHIGFSKEPFNYIEIKEGVEKQISIPVKFKFFGNRKTYFHYVESRNPYFITFGDGGVLFIRLGGEEMKFYSWEQLIGRVPRHNVLFEHNPSEVYITTDNDILKFDDNFELTNRLVFGNINETYTLLRFYIDTKGNYWIGTQEGGIIFMSHSDLKTSVLSTEIVADNNFEKIILKDDFIYGATDKASLYTIEEKSLAKYNAIEAYQKLGDVLVWQDKFVVTGGHTTMLMDNSSAYDIKEQKAFQVNIKQKLDFILEGNDVFSTIKKAMLSDQEDSLFFTRTQGTFLYDLKTKQSKLIARFNVNHMINFKDEYYFAKDRSLFIYNEDSLRTLVELPDIISTVFGFKESILWVGTYNAGLYEYNLFNNTITNISDWQLVKKIIRDNDHYLFASQDGIIKAELVDNKPVKLYCYNQKDGLPSLEIPDLKADSNYIYAATNKGIAKISKTHKAKGEEIKSKFAITEILINGKKQNIADFEKLSHRNNNISFNYHLLDYASKAKIEYSYKLFPIMSDWVTTSDRQISFNGLESGHYKLEIKAQGSLSETQIIKPINFQITQPFWKYLWFQLFVSGTAIIALIAVQSFRARKREHALLERKILDQKFAELKMQSLKAQMNPHFIFNALGSIQYYIQLHKVEEADEYLGKFAKVIRRYLDYATEDFITLEQEISLLSDYISLEKMRFESSFDVIFDIDKSLDLNETMIPTMIIQPFVENAIEHGLQTRGDKAGILTIGFKKYSKNEIACTIIDNGIGIEKAKSFRRIGHNSKGMQNITDRMNVLEQTGISKFSINITNLSTDVDFPGTKVHLVLQKRIYEN